MEEVCNEKIFSVKTDITNTRKNVAYSSKSIQNCFFFTDLTVHSTGSHYEDIMILSLKELYFLHKKGNIYMLKPAIPSRGTTFGVCVCYDYFRVIFTSFLTMHLTEVVIQVNSNLFVITQEQRIFLELKLTKGTLKYMFLDGSNILKIKAFFSGDVIIVDNFRNCLLYLAQTSFMMKHVNV